MTSSTQTQKILIVDNNPFFVAFLSLLYDTLKKHIDDIQAIWPDLADKVQGTTLVICDNFPEAFRHVQEVDRVVTDLNMPPDTEDRARHANIIQFRRWEQYYTPEGEPPMGILMVIEALAAGKPCTIISAGGHHGHQNSWLYDGYMRLMNREDQLFKYRDCEKDTWCDAFGALMEHVFTPQWVSFEVDSQVFESVAVWANLQIPEH